MAAVVHSLALLALLLWGKPVLAILPYSVMAAIMIMIAVSMVDDWAFVLVRQSGRMFLADCAVVVLVATTAVLVNLAVAVLSGVALAMVLFMLRMSQPVVSRVMDGTQLRSLKQRTLKMEAFFAKEGHNIIIVEMKGPLFFGTSEQIRDEFERLMVRKPKIIILDMRQVTYIDLSGARTLRQLGQAQKPKGYVLFLAGIKENSMRRDWLMAAGVTATIPRSQIFFHLDPALETAEETIAQGQDPDCHEEVPLSSLEILAGIASGDVARLSNLVERFHYDAGAAIFHQGQDGDGFYFLASGLIEIALPAGDGEAPIRLATLTPGTIFGEMALLDGKPRSANAIALAPAVSYFLSNASFARLHSECPAAAVRILLNIGREMSERLRLAHARFQSVVDR
jgi:SulP family sulfate permease